jgi:threonine dehydratase
VNRPVTGLRCAACGTFVDIATPLSWRCPRSTDTDRHHVLRFEHQSGPLTARDDEDPLLAFADHLAWRAFASANGLTADECDELTRQFARALRGVEGVGFERTPLRRAEGLSAELGFTGDGGVWVKDETGGVAGSHKARHLASIALHLLAAERLGLVPWGGGDRPPLAIASCGNAALAAATLAAALSWPLAVFVPPWANRHVTKRLEDLGAELVVCPRSPGDTPGDPCVHRFRRAVSTGALPFSVQGPENAWCLDSGRTIGWEIVTQLAAEGTPSADRLFVQVGGGALATCALEGMADGGVAPRLHPVQTAGCAPLARAWERCGGATGARVAAQRWNECMWPWEAEPASAASGILDDETYDWVGVVDAMARSGGTPIVVSEDQVLQANRLGRITTGIAVDHTGTAGLAGLLAVRDQVGDDERVVVLFTGRDRPSAATAPLTEPS